MKHSPTPWTSDPEGEVAVTIEDANGNPIADVYGGARDNPNATLIEAAPDLLEALLGMVSAHPPPIRGAFKGYVSPELQKALNAIQKATQP
jgi:hypothetical protein